MAYRHGQHGHSACGGFSMAETVVCVVVLGLVLTAAMRVSSAATMNQLKTSERAVGLMLAEGLLAEVATRDYADPGTQSLFGREAGEQAATKQDFNDVDDFNGWSESPPQDRSGTVLTGMTGWTRQVAVAWVEVPNVSLVSSIETGAKRVTVTVSKDGRQVVSAVAIRTNHP